MRKEEGLAGRKMREPKTEGVMERQEKIKSEKCRKK